MANAIVKISKRAKQISRANKNKAWKDCIAQASREYKAGKLGAVKKASTRQTGGSNLKRDKQRRAKPPGKRVSQTGSVYYERRKNRSDRPKSLTGVFSFFNVSSISNIDDLKKEYFRNAKKYHPDAGGSKEDFQKMQAEYESLYRKVLSGSNLNADEIRTEIELDEALRSAANAIVSIPGLNIELVGKWIWVSGNTYPVRNELKAAGFQFAPVKKMWYYKGVESAGRGTLTIDEIRGKYGSQTIKDNMKKLNGIGLTLSTARKRKFYLAIKKAVKAVNNRTQKNISVSGIARKVF